MGLSLDIQGASTEDLRAHAEAISRELDRRGEPAVTRAARVVSGTERWHEAELANTGIQFDTRSEAQAFADSLSDISCERLVQAAVARCRPKSLLVRLRHGLAEMEDSALGMKLQEAIDKVEHEYRAADGVVDNG